MNFFKRLFAFGKKRSHEPTGGKSIYPRSYLDASAVDEFTLKWGTNLYHIDNLILWQQRTAVARSRESSLNNPYVRRYLRMFRRNVIGSQGFKPQVKTDNPQANEAIEKAWQQWCKPEFCEISQQQGWNTLCGELAETFARDGEAFFTYILDPRNKFGFTLQPIDPQRCPPSLYMKALDNGNHLMNGIEFDEYNRPVAYYFTKHDTPQEAYINWFGEAYYNRILAENVCHVFERQFPNQKRGIPKTIASLYRLNQLKHFEHSALINARVSACKTMMLQQQYVPDEAVETEVDANGQIISSPNQEIAVDLKPGQVGIIPDGYTGVQFNPDYPNGEFGTFNQASLHGVASGLDVSYASLASDGNGVNFSTIRHFTIDERMEWQIQQDLICDKFCDWVFKHWLKEALLNRAIKIKGNPLTLARYDDYLNIVWSKQRWQWIDPQKDIMASMEAVSMGVKPLSAVANEQGYDFDECVEQLARDKASLEKNGLADLFTNFFKPQPQQTPQKEGGTDGEPTKPAVD